MSGRGWRLVTDRPWWMFLALLIAVGCGDDDDDRGRFGDLTALRVYRDTLNPIADAVSAIEIDDHTLIPHSYNASYLNLQPTIGKQARTPYNKLEFRDLDYAKEFGID